jgi:hypothetical protein
MTNQEDWLKTIIKRIGDVGVIGVNQNKVPLYAGFLPPTFKPTKADIVGWLQNPQLAAFGFYIETAGLTIIDIDEPELYKYFADIKTYTVKTRSGGYHLYFKTDKTLEDRTRRNKYNGWNVDLLEKGRIDFGKDYVVIKDLPILDEPNPERFLERLPKKPERPIDMEELKAKVSIDQVLSYYGITPKKVGHSRKILCPFHDDTNPSAVVNDDNIHCFTCNETWDIIGIVEKKENIDFKNSLKKIVNIFKVEMPAEKKLIKQPETTELDLLSLDADMENQFVEQRFGQRFGGDVSYYGLYLGMTLWSPDPKKPWIQKRVPINRIFTSEGKLYEVSHDNNSCLGLPIIFGSITNVLPMPFQWVKHFKRIHIETMCQSYGCYDVTHENTPGDFVVPPTTQSIPETLNDSNMSNNSDQNTHTRARIAKSTGCFFYLYTIDKTAILNSNRYMSNMSNNKPFLTDPEFLWKNIGSEDVPEAAFDLYDLFQFIRAKFIWYVGLPNEIDYDLATLWTICSYIYTIFPSFPYLQLNAVKESGKTRFLSTAAQMAFNSLFTMSQSTASIFRFIHGTGGTLIFDEAEGIELDLEKVQILNAGYCDGGFVLRTCKDNHDVQERFDVYCPKAFGSIANLPPTLVTRSIRIDIEKALTGKYDERIAKNDPDMEFIRSLLCVFGLQHGLKIKQLFGTHEFSHKGIDHRYWEMYHPLIVLAQYINPDMVPKLIEYIKGKVDDEKRARLLEDPDSIAMTALVKTITHDGFFDIYTLRLAIRKEMGAQDVMKTDNEGNQYIASWDESFRDINSKWVSGFLRNVNLPRRSKKKDESEVKRVKGTLARGRNFVVKDVLEQAVRMGVCEPASIGDGFISTLTGDRIE